VRLLSLYLVTVRVCVVSNVTGLYLYIKGAQLVATGFSSTRPHLYASPERARATRLCSELYRLVGFSTQVCYPCRWHPSHPNTKSKPVCKWDSGKLSVPVREFNQSMPDKLSLLRTTGPDRELNAGPACGLLAGLTGTVAPCRPISLLDHRESYCIQCMLAIFVMSSAKVNSTSAASTTTCRLQGGCHGVSCAAWSRAIIPQRSCSCRPPTCLVVADFARHHHIKLLLVPSSQPSIDAHF